MTTIPTVTGLAQRINLDGVTLIVGDDDEVATKWQAAYPMITDFVSAMADSATEINATLAAIETVVTGAGVEVTSPTTVDIGGDVRGSSAYNAALATALTTNDVLAGRELLVTNITGVPRTVDNFWAEYGPGGTPRWAGPLTPERPAFVAPTVEAGPDASVEVDKLFERAAIATPTDSVIVGYEWKIATTVIGNTETLRYRPAVVGVYTVSLTVTDSNRLTSTADTFTLTVEAQAALTAYDLAAQPSGNPATRIVSNQGSFGRKILSAVRPAFLADNSRVVVSYGDKTSTDPERVDVLSLSGSVLKTALRIEREPLPAYLDAQRVYGVWDYSGGEAFAYTPQWTGNAISFVYTASGGLSVGDGQGRQSHDDRYVVVRRESDDKLLCLDMRQNSIIASYTQPSWAKWHTITPDGRHILIGGGSFKGVWRYTRTFGIPTQISTTDDGGDCVMAADGYAWYVQTGAAAKAIEIHTGATTTINTSGASVSGTVSGASLVPNYVAVAWRVGAEHEIATMDLSDGAAMWTNRVTWDTLPAGVETRYWATPKATPSPDGRMILYQTADAPPAGDLHVYLVR